MGFYDEMQQIATGLLTEFNQGIISYVKSIPGNGPVDDPGAPTLTVYTLVGAVAKGVSKKFVDSGLAVVSDKQVTAAVDPRFIPDMNGHMIIDGNQYKILGIFQVPEAGTPSAFIYVVHKGQ
jgi:hypothetical protein